MAKPGNVVHCEIPQPNDVYSLEMELPIASFADAQKRLTLMKQQTDYVLVEEQIGNVIAYIEAHRDPFKRLNRTDRELLISDIHGFTYPQYPENLIHSVSVFLETIQM